MTKEMMSLIDKLISIPNGKYVEIKYLEILEAIKSMYPKEYYTTLGRDGGKVANIITPSSTTIKMELEDLCKTCGVVMVEDYKNNTLRFRSRK